MRRALLIVLLTTFAGVAQAVDVRGRVDFFGPTGAFPMAGAAVHLCNTQTNQCTGDFSTGGDGMYYFQGLGPGTYAVFVNGYERLKVGEPNYPAFDIPATRGN